MKEIRLVQKKAKDMLIAAYDDSDIAEGQIEYLLENILENEHIIKDDTLIDTIHNLHLEGLSGDEVAKKLQEVGVYEEVEKAVQDSAYGDSDLYQMIWDDEASTLGETLAEKSPDGYWKVEGRNLGWRNQSGYMYINLKSPDDGQDFLSRVLPKTNQLSYEARDSGSSISFKVSHHDAPTGEFYDAIPMTAEQWEQEGR